jgi:hypothetical protein
MYKMFEGGPLPPQDTPQEPPQGISYEKYRHDNPKNFSILSKFKFIIPALLIVGTIVLSAVLVKNYLQLNSLVVPSPTPAPTLIPATPQPTAKPLEVKKYFNLDAGFSFNYPASFATLDCPTQGAVYVYNELSGSTTTSCTKPGNNIVVEIDYAGSDFYQKQDSQDFQEQVILVADQSAIKQTSKTSNSYLSTITFSNENTFYKIKINSEQNISSFETVYQSFAFIKDQLSDWKTYENNYYSIKYPPDWSISTTETGEGVVKLSLNPDFSQLNTFRIDLSLGESNAQVTASEVISSTKTLSGWATTPSLNIKNLRKGTALILDGQFQAQWQSFIVIYYKNYFVQILWNDDIDQSRGEIFQNILSSFNFKN